MSGVRPPPSFTPGRSVAASLRSREAQSLEKLAVRDAADVRPEHARSGRLLGLKSQHRMDPQPPSPPGTADPDRARGIRSRAAIPLRRRERRSGARVPAPPSVANTPLCGDSALGGSDLRNSGERVRSEPTIRLVPAQARPRGPGPRPRGGVKIQAAAAAAFGDVLVLPTGARQSYGSGGEVWRRAQPDTPRTTPALALQPEVPSSACPLHSRASLPVRGPGRTRPGALLLIPRSGGARSMHCVRRSRTSSRWRRRRRLCVPRSGRSRGRTRGRASRS
jgi:hypothetical protein